MLSLTEVIEVFRKEYGPLLGKFVIHDLTVDLAPSNREVAVNSPGVYVFWKSGIGVIKVGKSHVNSKVRALKHIAAKYNTRNEKFQMTSLVNDSSCHLLLFNVQHNDDIHWILGLECFFEWKLKPQIPSRRCG